jgi:glutathione peroxidase
MTIKNLILTAQIAAITTLLTACFDSKEVRERPNAQTPTAAAQAAKGAVAPTTPPKMEKSTTTIYDFKLKSLDGDLIDFSKYKGKKLVILNVASKCGYTKQYADWQKFYDANKDKVEILGFPANNFMGQEPGTNKDIKEFCTKNYGVTFQMFEKISVKGDDKAPLYKWLTEKAQNGWNETEPSWNFCKYVINEKGELVKFFASGIKPTDEGFIATIK